MRFFKPKFKRYSTSMWALPLVGLMAMLVILLVAQTGAAQAQGAEDRWAGTVSDQDGAPVMATVTINGQEVQAKEDGSFELYVERADDDRYVINTEMLGYVPLSQIHIGIAMERMELRLNKAQVFEIDPSQATSVEDERGTQLSLPANSLVDAEGKPATGPLQLFLYTYNLEEEEMVGDMTGVDSKGNLVSLQSSGAFSAEFADASGNLYNLAPGTEAKISIPVDPDVSFDSIPLWSYDETKGLWIEEGEATQADRRYTGKVSHFSVWNFDAKWSTPACIKLTVDSDDLPIEMKAVLYSPYRVRYLTINQTTNALYNLPPNANVDLFTGPPSYSTLYATVNTGAPWGGTGIPPYPYDDCNGELQISSTTLSCEDVEGYPGDTLLVDLIASGTDVYGLQVNSAVDPSIVAVQSGAFGDFFDSPYLAAINYADAAAGTWDGAASQQNPNPAVTGSGTFATVTYQAISPGSSDMTLTPLFSDRDGFELPGSATACTLTVLDYGSISGTVTYQGRLTHADIEVVAGGVMTNTDLTDSNGDFDIGGLQAGDYQVRADVASYLPACAADVPVTNGQLASLPSTQLLGGDVNDDIETDLVINIGDATRLGASFGQPASADVQADINADGTINVQDLSILGGNYDVSGCQVW